MDMMPIVEVSGDLGHLTTDVVIAKVKKIFELEDVVVFVTSFPNTDIILFKFYTDEGVPHVRTLVERLHETFAKKVVFKQFIGRRDAVAYYPTRYR